METEARVIGKRLKSLMAFSRARSSVLENPSPILLVGLGNPGDEYARHRHNIGFMVIEAIAAAEPAFGPFRKKFQGLLSEANQDGCKVVLLKPQTYMNNSGQSVAAAAKFYKAGPDRIVVFHDELDLPPGDIRVKKGGGNAGHNGLKSIQAHLGTPDFRRVRIGIGHPGHRDRVSDYVLSNFPKAEQVLVEDILSFLSGSYKKCLAQEFEALERKSKNMENN